MKKNLVIGLICCAAAAALSGCVNTVDGHSKAGVPWLKDKIESRYERSLPQVMNAAREALKVNGTIISDDVVINTLKASVNTRTVFVKCEEVDPKVTRVIVQVRTKGGGNDIDLAAEIDKQIALHLKN
ncbi:MAG TPA: DUF3568 family protein [Verrucomicrobiae bacterium]